MRATRYESPSPGLRVQTVRSRSIRANDRLDAAYFTAHGSAVAEDVLAIAASGVRMRPLQEIAGRVSMPNRAALVRAVAGEERVPYLRPYDVFDYIPTASDHLSVPRNMTLDDYRLRRETILQTRSGRNLGPCTITDSDLSAFALSDDMIRIEVDDERERYFLLAFLQTSMGQTLLRRGRSGSVVDHLTVTDIKSVPVPELDASLTAEVSKRMRDAIRMRERGRQSLRTLLSELERHYPVPAGDGRPSRCWSTSNKLLLSRLDAAYYSPIVNSAREQMAGAAGGRLTEIARPFLPLRYKRYYVEQGFGRAIVSGRQLLQCKPINLRYVSDRSFKRPDEYVLTSGMTIFGAVGRAEGRQGWPALVTGDRDGWLASNDVMRLTPIPGVLPGRIWLAVATPQVQIQINALSFGSVVDHMEPSHLDQVFVPPITDQQAERAEAAWSQFAFSNAEAEAAVTALDLALTRSGGGAS